MPTNNAEGGTNGTTVTTGNSGGASGRAFDTVTIAAGSTLAFDNTAPANGALAYKYQLGTTAGSCYLQWLAGFSGGDITRAFFRFNAFWAANPATTIYQLRLASAANVALGGVQIDTAGKLVVGATTMATAVPLNAWFHVEVDVTVVGATATAVVRRS